MRSQRAAARGRQDEQAVRAAETARFLALQSTRADITLGNVLPGDPILAGQVEAAAGTAEGMQVVQDPDALTTATHDISDGA